MIFFTKEMLKKYYENDYILKLMNDTCEEDDGVFISHKWLSESIPKRMIYSYMYGDLIQEGKSLKLLDVGGGYCSLSKIMLSYHNYFLVDIMAHDDFDMSKSFLIKKDWEKLVLKSDYDIVIANDIFPNVDQRMSLFIDKFIPVCKEIRIMITYYNYPRFYSVKRQDADEIFCFLAWDGMQVKSVLKKHIDRISQPDLDTLLENRDSLFDNKRQVCMVTIRGDC